MMQGNLGLVSLQGIAICYLHTHNDAYLCTPRVTRASCPASLADC